MEGLSALPGARSRAGTEHRCFRVLGATFQGLLPPSGADGGSPPTEAKHALSSPWGPLWPQWAHVCYMCPHPPSTCLVTPPHLTRYPVGLPGGGSQLKWIFRDPAALALGFCGAPRSPRGGGGDDTVWFITLRSSSSAGYQAGQSAETPLWLWGGRNPSTPPGGTRCLVKHQDSFPLTSHHMYGCERWTIKSAEHQSIDAFELCWRRLLRVPWTARRSNQSILKEVSLNVHWKD